MFKFKIVDRESYNNLIDLCNKVLAKNEEVLFLAIDIHRYNEELMEFNNKILKDNEELMEFNNKILKDNEEIIEFNKHLLDLNGLSVKKENEDAEN